MSKTYKVVLKCANCFYTWGEKFPKGVEAVEYVGVSLHWIDDANGESVKCPNCKCGNVGKVDLSSLEHD